MLTDDYLPQPFRFLNQIVRQVVEDAIDIAVQREASLTQVKRLRVPKDIVQLPLMIGLGAATAQREHNNNNTSKDYNNAGAIPASSSAAAFLQQIAAEDGTSSIDTPETKGFTVAKSGGAVASSSTLPAFITAVGDAGAMLVLARNGTFTVRDQTLPLDDEDDNADGCGMTAPVPGMVGEITVVPVATSLPLASSALSESAVVLSNRRASAAAPANPFASVVGCLPFAPGEEVAAACISAATGAVAIATAFTASASSNSAFFPYSSSGPSTPVPVSALLAGGGGGGGDNSPAGGFGSSSSTAAAASSSNCGGRLLLYSSIPPATGQQQQQHGAVPIRRSALSKLALQQQPDFAVLLPLGCAVTKIEISADEQFVAVVVVAATATSASSSSAAQAGNPLSNFSSNAAVASSTLGTPEVLIYRKIQPQDCFFGAPGLSAGSGLLNSPGGGNNDGSSGTASLLSAIHNQQQQQQQQSSHHSQTRIQLPPQCDTTLVLIGCLSPPSYAAASSSVPPSAVAPFPFFLHRPVDVREAHTFPVVCHTVFVAWGGFSVFSTASLASQCVEMGTPEIMRGSALEFAAVASAATAAAVVAVTPPPPALPLSTSFRKMNSSANLADSMGLSAPPGAAASTLTQPPAPSSPPVAAAAPSVGFVSNLGGGGGVAAATPNVAPPLPPLIPVCTGIDPVRHVCHRPLPQIITTASQCRISGRVALGLAEGVVGVWTQEPPCFSTITVAAPHRSDTVRANGSSRRPMVVTSVSFYRNTHLVAALSVPVQIKSVDDIPSVHYSKVIIVELASGSIVASIPHVPSLSLAVALTDLPIVLLFGGGRSFWAASIYTGELLAEVPCTVHALASALTPPSTVAGKPLIAFCNALQASIRACPFTGSLYGTICCGAPGASSPHVSPSSAAAAAAAATTPYFFRVDGVSLVAALRPLQGRRDDIVRSHRNLPQVAGIVSQALISRAGNKDAEAAAMSITKQQQQRAAAAAAAAAATSSTAASASAPTQAATVSAMKTPAAATAAAATAALAAGFAEAASVLAAATATSSFGRKRGGNKGGSSSNRRKVVPASSGDDTGGYSSADENAATVNSSTLQLVPQPPTVGNFASLGARSTMASSINFDATSTRGGGGTASAAPSGISGGFTQGMVTGAINELATLPIAEIGKKLVAGRAERAKKVNKLLDSLLATAQAGVTVIGK